ncbi:MAG: ATP-binding protein [Bacteroidia bacterium]
MKKLPIGIQSFEKIRSDSYIYVDKTRFIYNLINEGTYYFLSRPRRFGKSLMIDTLKCLFEGKKHLFEGLFIYDKWNWDQQYPVIRISFGSYKKNINDPDDLEKYIVARLNEIANNHNVSLSQTLYYEAFRELIIKLSGKNKVVVLVDEYDKPILDVIDDFNLCYHNREILKGFYQIIKDADEYLKFGMLTGVSKFSKVSIFSGLNNLYDISVNEKYSAICGYTENDLDIFFSDYLKDVDRNEMKKWYNGYSWMGENVYNPFDLLHFFKEKKFKSYWFQTGTPTFLIKLLADKKFYIPNIENIIADDIILSSFDIENIDPIALLFQTGYLTIKQILKKGIKEEFVLSYPNLEVKNALNNSILQSYTHIGYQKNNLTNNIYDGLETGNIEILITQFQSLFAGIPYQWYVNNHLNEYEGYFASVFYSVFQSLGLDCIAEDITNKGRIDLTVKIGEYIYIFEFKVIEHFSDSKKAIEQIQEKKYYEKYLSENKTIFLVGIDFSKEERNIKNYDYEKITQSRSV